MPREVKLAAGGALAITAIFFIAFAGGTHGSARTQQAAAGTAANTAHATSNFQQVALQIGLLKADLSTHIGDSAYPLDVEFKTTTSAASALLVQAQNSIPTDGPHAQQLHAVLADASVKLAALRSEAPSKNNVTSLIQNLSDVQTDISTLATLQAQ